MRVLHVITSGQRRGGDVFASDLASVLDSTGIQQIVAAIRPPKEPVVPYPGEIRVLCTRRLLPGINVDAGGVKALRALIKRWRPDIVQAHGGEPFKYVLAANPLRRPAVVYRRIGGAPSWITRGPRKFVHAQLMRRASLIVAVAESVRRETIAVFGVSPSIIRTIRNGVSVDRIKPTRGRVATRRALGIPDGSVVTVSVGALSWEKDPLVQLQIARRVLQVRPDAFHIFVGDGPLRRRLEGGIRALGLVDRCFVLGSRTDVGDLLAGSDVFLFTSRADGMEGMPATVIEAGMAGVPVAAYSILGVPEVVEHGATGLLAPQGDIDELSKHVVKLVRDSSMRQAMGEAASERLRNDFDIRTIAPQYVNLYSSLLSVG